MEKIIRVNKDGFLKSYNVNGNKIIQVGKLNSFIVKQEYLLFKDNKCIVNIFTYQNKKDYNNNKYSQVVVIDKGILTQLDIIG